MEILGGIKVVIDDNLSLEQKADIIINELRTKPQYRITNNNKESTLVSGIALLKHINEGEFNFLVKKLLDEGLVSINKEGDIITEIRLEYKGYFHQGFVKIKNDMEASARRAETTAIGQFWLTVVLALSSFGLVLFEALKWFCHHHN
jgi:hypothetical protein